MGRNEDIVRDTGGFRANFAPSEQRRHIDARQASAAQIAAATISAMNPTSANHALRMTGDLSQHVLELRELFKLIGGNVFG